MPRYFYSARDQKGELQSGILEAKDQRDLAKIIKEKGYFLISADLEGKPKRKFSIPFLGNVSFNEKVNFIRNLKVMISAGLSLPQALKILSNQTTSKKFKKTISAIEQNIIKGSGFSESLEKHPSIFPEFLCNMVKVGEEAGTLEEVLGVLLKQMEKERAIKSKIKGALVYPAVIVIAMIVIGILMMIMVVPKLAKTFEELKVDLPITTRFVIWFGNSLANFWYLIPFILIGFWILFSFIFKSKRGKHFLAKAFLTIPLIRIITRKINSAQTARTLSSLIASGVPIVRALEITSGTVGNVFFKNSLLKAMAEVQKGGKLGESLKISGDVFPNLFTQMVEIGEETGETSSMLEKLADFYEEEVDNFAKNFSSVIEPVLMIIIGAAVGFFAVSMIQPMYSMMDVI